jgi:hypothetical protein
MSWLPLLESCCSQIDLLLVKIEHEVTVQLPAAAIMALLLLLRHHKFRTQKKGVSNNALVEICCSACAVSQRLQGVSVLSATRSWPQGWLPLLTAEGM